jgi:hypothetical protein
LLKQTAGEIQSFQPSKSAILERKIEETAAGLQMSFTKALHNLSEANAPTTINHTAAVRVEVNPSDNYRKDLIDILSKFARYAFNDKNNQNVFNHHDHSRISEDDIQSNEGHASNDEDSHYNDNFNSNRGETFDERFKCNSHSKPANTDEEVIPCDDDD